VTKRSQFGALEKRGRRLKNRVSFAMDSVGSCTVLVDQ